MTNQELFDKVVLHMRTQEGFARDGKSGSCLYRAANGRKCAAGILILDEHYHSGLEGNGADALSVQEALIASGVAPDQISLVRGLQKYAHDEPAFGAETVEWGLTLVARNYDLVYTPPQGDVA